jgi:hypothetical protein
MGDPEARRYDDQVRRYFTPRCLGMHVTLLIVLPAFGWLTAWQLSRALGGNALSWAYTFEWPLFAIYAIYMWWQLIHDQPTPGSRRIVPSHAAPGAPDDQRPPGWALSGGRRKNVAIAYRTAVDEGGPARGERFAEQTAEEAAALAEYNRYLAALNAADAESSR